MALGDGLDPDVLALAAAMQETASVSKPRDSDSAQSAVTKVFSTFELIEMILCCGLSLSDLVRAQKVNKAFHDTIARSKSVQEGAADDLCWLEEPDEPDQWFVYSHPQPIAPSKTHIIFDNGNDFPSCYHYFEMIAHEIRRSAYLGTSTYITCTFRNVDELGSDSKSKDDCTTINLNSTSSTNLWRRIPIGIRLYVRLEACMGYFSYGNHFEAGSTLGDIYTWLCVQTNQA